MGEVLITDIDRLANIKLPNVQVGYLIQYTNYMMTLTYKYRKITMAP